MSVYVTDLDPKELKTYEQPKFDFIFFQNFTNTKKTFFKFFFKYLKGSKQNHKYLCTNVHHFP